jgi:hypothetical protein
MKIVDDKGKIFGIINVFDLFVLCAMGFAAFFIFKWTVSAEDPSWVKVQTVRVKCEAIATMPSYIADLVKEGDTMRDDDGVVVARIEKILKVEPMKARISVYSAGEEENVVLDTESKKMTLLLDLLACKKKNSLHSYAAGNLLNPGFAFTFNTKGYSTVITYKKVLGYTS